LALVAALLALAAALAAATARPRWLPEALVAAVGAALLVAIGAIGTRAAGHALRELGPTVGFLAALLVLADGCRRQGVFAAIGEWLASGSGGRRTRLLALTFAACTAVTVVLGLDATVVLLTPVVFLTAARLRASPKPYAYACTHLANSASLLLAVSNLTNLLAFHASRLTFVHFAALMALPWLASIALEWVVLRRFFARELTVVRSHPPVPVAGMAPTQAPLYALAVLAVTLSGFALSSAIGTAPVWFAAAGAAAITLPELARRRVSGSELIRSLQPGFLVFVLGLGVIVAVASEHGLSSAVRAVLPSAGSLPDLLLIAAVSAALANLVNNLPATLMLLPVTGALGTGPVLAMLIGVNIGPNLTYAGSLATLLWRRVLRAQAVDVGLGEFTRLGLLTVPVMLALCTVLVWVSVRAWG
jgi:arsenical pump membrane protein